MIEIKQSRKLKNGFRTLTIKHESDFEGTIDKDVLRVLNDKGIEIFNLDIEKDGIIRIWSNEFILHVDKDI